MDHEENHQELSERDDLRIKCDLDRLSMSGCTCADLAIGWVRHNAAGIARNNFLHPAQFAENGFKAPEAAPSQCCHFSKIVDAQISPLLFSR